MEEKENRYGLLGKDISYSFSRGYFLEKFTKLNLSSHSYVNFDLKTISEFKSVLKQKNIAGLNVTIPYKEAIIPYLDNLDSTAKKIGAVNTIKFTKTGLKGFNTDAYGFEKAISTHLKSVHQKALILGTGGASKAIAYVFTQLNIPFKFVSRKPKAHQITYTDLDIKTIQEYQIIVNCSPVGTYPNINDKPNLCYEGLGKNHLLFDLIYNPKKTAFLKIGEKAGSITENGLSMLEFQAEKSWEIWNS